MKTRILIALALGVATSITVNAQSQKMQPYLGKSPKEVRQVTRPEGFTMPKMGLDDKQREEIGKIRTEQVKERTQTRNLLKEKRAKLEVLQTADKPDMKEINKVIEEIASIRAQEMKAMAANRQKIRGLLTEEQRVYFDAHRTHRGKAQTDRKHLTTHHEHFRGPKGERPQWRMDKDQPPMNP